MSDSSADRDPLERLAEEFVARYRRGERPSVNDYADRHLDLAEQIRDLFPALVEMEQIKPVSGDHTGNFVSTAVASDPVRVGEFRILRRVGQGGMGVVYEAVQESLGRHVALKMLPTEAVADPKRLERFRREAQAAARLHHTNIVPVFGVGAADGRHYYAMQFIAGHPLDAVIDEVRRLREKSTTTAPVQRPVSEVARALMTGTFAAVLPSEEATPPFAPTATHASPADGAVTVTAPAVVPVSPAPTSSSAFSGTISEGGRHYWGTVARIGAQVADALAYAHAQGVIHRDIKPANLLLDLRGTVWVTDFGLAKAADTDDLTHAGDIVGTLRYMAPERFDGLGDNRADVYALGLTLYELLTLTPAFTAENRAKLVEQVLAASPPSPRSINPAIPRDLETVVLKAIARDPAMRYQSATELADDLRRYLEDRPIRARRASSFEQAWRWCRRNPTVANLIAAVVMVSLGGAAVSSYFAVKADSERGRAERREGEAKDERNRANAKAAELESEQGKLQAERDRISRVLYASQMNHASVALSEGRIGRVLEILSETTPQPGEPDLRGWEWHYLDRLTRPPGRSFSLAGTGAVSPKTTSDAEPRRYFSAEISADGRRVAYASPEEGGYRIQIWDMATGRLVAMFPASGAPIASSQTLRPRLSLDGRILSVRSILREDGYSTAGKLRVWDVDSGRELSVPAEAQGPNVVDAGWRSNLSFSDTDSVRWVERTTIPQVLGLGLPFQSELNPRLINGRGTWFGEPLQSPEYLLRRWDRASGRLTTHRFRPGNGNAALLCEHSSADGRIAIFQDESGWGPGGGGRRRPAESLAECWDVAADPPRRLWSAQLPMNSAIGISPGGKMVAVVHGASATVYHTEGQGGEPRIASKMALPLESGRFGSPAVSDDGRLAFSHPHRLTFYCPETLPATGPVEAEEVTRQQIFYHRDTSYYYPIQFTPDGRTLLTVDQGTGIVRTWDTVPEPLSLLARGPTSSVVSPDGRLVVEVPTLAFGNPQTSPVSDLIFKETATGKEVGRIALQGGWVFPQFVAGSRRVLVINRIANKGNPQALAGSGLVTTIWTLYDTDGLRSIAKGEVKSEIFFGTLGVSPAGRWLIEGVGEEEFVVRDPMTGEPTCRVRAPDGGLVVAVEFNPTEDRMVVTTTGAVDPRTMKNGFRPGSLSVQVCDPATGVNLWAPRELDHALFDARNLSYRGLSGPNQIVWSPDGQRILVRYRATATESRVWVGRSADGTTERTLVSPSDTREIPNSPVGVLDWVRLDPSGRRVAVSGSKEVRIWDLESGSLVATLRGFDGLATSMVFNADSSRLFVQDSPFSLANSLGIGIRVGVWDMTTNRLLFVLQPLSHYVHTANGSYISGSQLQFRDGKLTYPGPRIMEKRVLDGTPVKE